MILFLVYVIYFVDNILIIVKRNNNYIRPRAFKLCLRQVKLLLQEQKTNRFLFQWKIALKSRFVKIC